MSDGIDLGKRTRYAHDLVCLYDSSGKVLRIAQFLPSCMKVSDDVRVLREILLLLQVKCVNANEVRRLDEAA